MNKVIENWDPSEYYVKGTVIKFDSKLYLAQLSNQGILPIHRVRYVNALNSYSNAELVDRLLQEYQCKEDLPTTKAAEDGIEMVGLNTDPTTFSTHRGSTESYHWKEL